MSLPVSAYTNLALVVPRVARLNAAQKKAAARAERNAETRIKEKVEQAQRVLVALERREAQFAAAIKALQARKNLVSARIERIEERALSEMTQAGLSKVEGIRTTFAARPCPAALVVEDEKLVPDEYMRETISRTPEKALIKAALARGVEVAGVSLSQRVTLIRK